MTRKQRQLIYLLLAVAVLTLVTGYVTSIGWRWNRPANFANLAVVAVLGVVSVAVTVGTFAYRSVLLAFAMGPAWVSFAYAMVFWNDGTGPLDHFLQYVWLVATFLGAPIGAALALVAAVVFWLTSRTQPR